MRTKADRVGPSWYGVSHHVWDILLIYGKGLRGWSFAKARRWFIVTLEEGERERSRVTLRNEESRVRHPPFPLSSAVSLPPTVTTPFCQNDVPTKPAGGHWYRALPFVAFVATSSPSPVLRRSRCLSLARSYDLRDAAI